MKTRPPFCHFSFMPFTIAIGCLLFACKKESKKMTPITTSVTITGTYHLISAVGVNDDGTTYNKTLQDCVKANIYTFDAMGNLNTVSACSTGNTTGRYKTIKDTLFIYDGSGRLADKGIVSNLTTTGFVYNEDVINWSSDILTFGP